MTQHPVGATLAVAPLAPAPLAPSQHPVGPGLAPAQLTEHRTSLAAAATVNASGQFEIIAMTEGQGNGWNFSAAVLKDSLKLWNGVNSCIDHAGFFEMPSVLKLCGVAHSPTWSDEHKGIRLNLKPFGPMANIVTQLATELLAARNQNQPTPKVGFSGDIGFKAKGNDVTEIMRIHRLDLVLDPARGGDFLRALNQQGVRADVGADVGAGLAPARPAPPAPQGRQRESVERLWGGGQACLPRIAAP